MAVPTAEPLAVRSQAPYRSQDPREVSTLLKRLEDGIKKGKVGGRRGFQCRKSTFEVHNADGVKVNSWKFMDWDYKRDDLPTYARGLFTYQGHGGTPEIAVRGYDKFFNVGEVNDTQWGNVETRTRGPYELSNKENGCIIFISGLENDILLVCSKHSTGLRGDSNANHALAGEKWVEKHLATVGRTPRDLARELKNRNVTLVAELCDDSFEEHVLAYDKDVAGLYVHGINLNVPEFATYPGHLVQEFATRWGFKKAEYIIKDDLASAKAFLDNCAETGSWNGRDTEGFVIRCQKKEGDVWVDWFFKYKFEEPYLMYRQWREATKAVIAGKRPKYKKHRQITEEYLLFARRQLAANPALCKAYNNNHGIIKMRDDFLAHRGMKGSDIIRQEVANGGDAQSAAASNVVLVTVASIGCGKTTVAVALLKLFPTWGHVQNDNITGQKGRPQQFALKLTNSLASNPVVIADRNNHQKRERKQIFDDITRVIPSARYVALNYVHDPKDKMLPSIRKVTQARVLERGDNHQTIRTGSKDKSEIIAIMEGFLNRLEPVDPAADPDNNFDEIINLNVVKDSRHNLDIVVNALHKAFPKLVPEVPSPDELDKAMEAALSDYSPEIKHDLSFQSKSKNQRQGHQQVANADGAATPKPPDVEYFAVHLPPAQVVSALAATFDGTDAETARFYRQLQQTRRIQPGFHVTLIHQASVSQRPDLWNELDKMRHDAQASHPDTMDPLLGRCRVQLERVVWDDRVMCVVARLLDEGWQTANAVAHVTIGTSNHSIKPKETNGLLAKWKRLGATAESRIHEAAIQGAGELDGEVKAVIQRPRRAAWTAEAVHRHG